MPKKDWFQILTNIGVVAGLAILIYELNQSRVQMDAQMVSTSFQMGFQNNLAVLGENPAPIIAKACTNLAKLSPEEQVVLDAIHNSTYIQIEHAWVMATLGVLGEEWWKPATRMAYIFAHPAGVAWWKGKRPTAHKALVEVIDNGIARGEHENLCHMYGITSTGKESV